MSGSQKRVFRCRNITSCKRCFQSKRKCSKTKPSCDRCERIKTPCVYFTEDQLENRKKLRKDVAYTDVCETPNTEIIPQPRSRENYNFKLIVNSTGEYSKYFPMSLFPFYEHSSNVSWIVDSKKNTNQTVAVFDFNVMFKHLANLSQILEYIPKRKLCDQLVDHFFKNVFPIIPIVDKEEFDLKYKIFWKKPSAFEDLNALMLLFAILFCSSTSMLINEAISPSSKTGLDYQTMRIDYFDCIENLKYMLNTNMTPSLSSLTSFALIYYVGSMNGFPLTIQITNLAKLAQMFGLHRKVTQKLNSTPLRDVVYCFIWFLDAMSTYYTGLPTNLYASSFESETLFPNKSNDFLSLFFLGRLHNAKVWVSVLDKINQIEKCSIDEYHNIDLKFDESVIHVNRICDQLLESNDTKGGMHKWMRTELRMGVAKSFVLMFILRHSLSYLPTDDLISKLTTDLVLQSLLLINESLLKLIIGRRVLPTCMWYNRLCFPFQAMYIVLSHIRQYPNHHLNLSMLDSKYQFTLDPDLGLDVLNGDLRLPIVEKCLQELPVLEAVWTPVTIERFSRIAKYKQHVVEQLSMNPDTSNNVSPSGSGPIGGKSPLEHGHPQRATPSHTPQQRQPEIISNSHNNGIGPAPVEAYTFLDDGLQFMFGEDFVNRSINAIVSDMDIFYNSLN